VTPRLVDLYASAGPKTAQEALFVAAHALMLEAGFVPMHAGMCARSRVSGSNKKLDIRHYLILERARKLNRWVTWLNTVECQTFAIDTEVSRFAYSMRDS
jgi:hypothetical protein